MIGDHFDRDAWLQRFNDWARAHGFPTMQHDVSDAPGVVEADDEVEHGIAFGCGYLDDANSTRGG